MSMPIDLENLPDAPGLDLWREGAVLWIRLNRPERRNAIDLQSRDVLRALLWDLNTDPSVRAVVLTHGDPPGRKRGGAGDRRSVACRKPVAPQGSTASRARSR